MYYVANYILHDEFLAEDAVQQSFMKIYNHLDKIGENYCRKTRNFLFIICRNVMYTDQLYYNDSLATDPFFRAFVFHNKSRR